MGFRQLLPGEPAPWFVGRSADNPQFHFDTVAGRRIVLCLFGSAAHPVSAQTLECLRLSEGLFDDHDCWLMGVSVDPQDEQQGRVVPDPPRFHQFWDFNGQIGRLYGALQTEPSQQYAPRSVVLDERLRVVAVIPFSEAPQQHVAEVRQALESLPPLCPAKLADNPAPVLVVPRIFEPELCTALIDYYEQHGGQDSGFMRDVGGQTVLIQDYNHKRRRDREIDDEQLRQACMHRIHNRLVPEIHKAFQFKATRIERYIVACYESETGGHFRAHRDNTTKGTAHRRFAVSLNLNTGAYEGGEIWFPEFGRQRYAAPAGGAVVFSCSLLHEATPVTSGKRFVFLPFLYDDAAAVIRQQNQAFVVKQSS